MGYNTDFQGEFVFEEPLSIEQEEYLRAFCNTRRMKRNALIVKELEDTRRKAVKLPVGIEGEFYVGSADDGNHGQSKDKSVLDSNTPPRTQPGLWCGWTPSEGGEALVWCGQERFYNYIEWIKYIVRKFVKRWGLVLDGEVMWQGESLGDVGKIVIKKNVIKVKKPRWD